MGVKHNHTKFEQETQRWRPGTGFASGGPQSSKTAVQGQKQPFLGQKSPEHIQNGQTKGNGVYTSRAA